MKYKSVKNALSIAGAFALIQTPGLAQSPAHGVKQSDEWLQRPLLHVEQLPAGFYYIFRDGDTRPTYCIKVPTAEEKQHGEMPYIENRAHARSIDSQYGLKSEDPHLSYEHAAADSPEPQDSKAATTSALRPSARKDASKTPSPFKRNTYWNAIKSLPKSASHALYGQNPADPKPLPLENENASEHPSYSQHKSTVPSPAVQSDPSDNSDADAHQPKP